MRKKERRYSAYSFLPSFFPCRHFVGDRIEIKEGEDGEEERNSHTLNRPLPYLTPEGGRNGNVTRNRGIKRKEAFSPDRSSKSELLVIAGLDDPDEDLDRDVGDEDDDDDEESPGRAPANCDIERLKAFNVIQSSFLSFHLLLNFQYRCLFGFSLMKTWIEWFLSPVNRKRRFRPLLKAVIDSSLNLWNALEKGSEHI